MQHFLQIIWRVGNICAFYTNASNLSYLQSSEVWQQDCNMIRLADGGFLYLFLIFFSLDQHNSELFSAIYLLECKFPSRSPALCVRQESKGTSQLGQMGIVRTALCKRNRNLIFFLYSAYLRIKDLVLVGWFFFFPLFNSF